MSKYLLHLRTLVPQLIHLLKVSSPNNVLFELRRNHLGSCRDERRVCTSNIPLGGEIYDSISWFHFAGRVILYHSSVIYKSQQIFKFLFIKRKLVYGR